METSPLWRRFKICFTFLIDFDCQDWDIKVTCSSVSRVSESKWRSSHHYIRKYPGEVKYLKYLVRDGQKFRNILISDKIWHPVNHDTSARGESSGKYQFVKQQVYFSKICKGKEYLPSYVKLICQTKIKFINCKLIWTRNYLGEAQS